VIVTIHIRLSIKIDEGVTISIFIFRS